ncbi:UbiA prenyltransferase family protein [Neorhodopirellula lusitana]|uniref:UbiA prenyltransferase family protein n=1 Tax=Neorhodopirellula lusitana TaxID=445327 RepID=A0ABY1PPY2_9BACT|nr:UbiA family prenyltransferase [Neorhodopirellula lusitana]SMP38390.1 UbiA prenyltransferase family protein [Neorhodopirellula lusitana]
MNETAARNSPAARIDWQAWARLVRLPNVFTIIADISAAFFLVLGTGVTLSGAAPGSPLASLPLTDPPEMNSYMPSVPVWVMLVCAVTSGVLLYWGGMVLNDVFDVEQDTLAERERPLVNGDLSVATARKAGWGLLAFGLVPTLLIGLITSFGTASEASSIGLQTMWSPLAIAAILAVLVVLYDGPCKRTPLAPILMGGCRVFSFLLGVTAANAAIGDLANTPLQAMRLGPTVIGDIRSVALMFAIGMGTYIAGLTTFGRREATGEATIHLPLGLLMMLAGGALLTFAPHFGGELAEGVSLANLWQVDPTIVFPTAILLMLAGTIFHGRRAIVSPSPAKIQATIRSGLLAIIPIAATITMLSVGAFWAITVFALMVPSRILAQRIRMT